MQHRFIKWIHTIFLFSLLWYSCESEIDYDGRFSEIENRITLLEQIVEAQKNGDVITSVTPIFENEVVVGYKLEFKLHEPIIVMYGKDGVEGKDGDSMFKSISVTEFDVSFLTSDGKTFIIKRAVPFDIEFNSSDLNVLEANSERTIKYTITTNSDEIFIDALSSEDVKVKIVKETEKSGSICISTGTTIDEYSKVLVFVCDGSQTIVRALYFEEACIKVEEGTEKSITDEGGNLILEYFSNFSCKAVLSDDAKSWISISPDTKSISKQTIQISIQPNIGWSRSATIGLVSMNDDFNASIFYTITQEAGPQWKNGLIPPDDEIWYTTTDGNKASFFENLDYGVPFLSNSYVDGKGVIKCAGKIKIITLGSKTDLDKERTGRKKVNFISLPNCVRETGISIFTSTNVSEFHVPDSMRYYHPHTFDAEVLSRVYGEKTSEDERCVLIDGVVFQCALKGIDEYTFPSGVREIFGGVCGDNKTLKHVVLPDGLKIIGGGAFAGCSALTGDIYLPNSLEKIDYYAFIQSPNINGFYGNASFFTDDHLCLTFEQTLFDDEPHKKGKWIAVFVGNGLTDYVIPEGIKGIENYAFKDMTKLRSITFPSTLEDIGIAAFEGCSNLEMLYGECVSKDHKGVIFHDEFNKLLLKKGVTKYVVPDGIKKIGYGAFQDCPDLEEIIIPDCVTELGGYDFSGCNKLKKVVLSSSLEKIKTYNPFLACHSLREIYFRSYTPPFYSDKQFYENDCRNLTVYVPQESLDLYKKSSWSQYAPYMKGYNYTDIGQYNPDYYVSSDYSLDGKVTSLSQASEGNGIDVVIMGDAFSDRQVSNNIYYSAMQKAKNAFFSEEPYKSFKHLFNVYAVNVISPTEGYEHSGQALGTSFVNNDVTINGNDAIVLKYAKKAIPENRLDDALIIVILNEDRYAGTCYFYDAPDGDYGRGTAIAYCPLESDTNTFIKTVLHEGAGHGFAKLADEYGYESMGNVSTLEIVKTKSEEKYGWWKNVDFTNDPNDVKWAQFIKDSRYSKEKISCYEGGLTYWSGVWHPTEESLMNGMTGGFNAPSRYAIWYRINKLAYGNSWDGSYEDFVSYDAINVAPSAISKRISPRRNYVDKHLPVLAPPVVVGHSWREAK